MSGPQETWRSVVLESPYAGDVERNLRYVRACMRDCIKRGDAPFPSHALYTQDGVLDDNIHEERELGIEAGLAIGKRLEATVIYADLGHSSGMLRGVERARVEGRPFEVRLLGGEWASSMKPSARDERFPEWCGADAIGGLCPVQAEGELGGAFWYFRARGEHWTLTVSADPDERYASLHSKPLFECCEPYGTEPYDAGYMPEAEAITFIMRSLFRWREQAALASLATSGSANG